jgi:lipopolysaccharide transport system permease protein
VQREPAKTPSPESTAIVSRRLEREPCFMNAQTENTDITIIEPPGGWNLIDFQELGRYRDLFRFLVWRDIKVLYAQTVLGFAWALLNPLIQILIFTVIFGGVAKITFAPMPFFIATTVAVIPWTYMQEAMIASSQSLVTGQAMLGKIYFPRLIFPLTPVLAKLVDFSISLVVLVALMTYCWFVPYEDPQTGTVWRLELTSKMLFLPLFAILMVCVPAGIGLWLSSLSIRFRDVKFAMPFVTRMLVYSAPIMYPATSIESPTLRVLYSLNPIVTVVDGFRSCLLNQPFEWQYILPGVVTAVVLLITGAFYFRRTERVFVDVI